MDLLDLVVKITADDQASSKIDGVGSSVIAKGTAIGSMVSQGITAAAGAVVEFGKETIQTGMSFDSAMSQVAATMGTTTDNIGSLRDMAKEMGSSTKFSATEAAEAMNYMALAGYDVNTTMEMLPTVLDLAAAGGMDLASASDMVTDSQTALGLSTEETSALVDQMAQTASKSNTSVSQLGDAILTVGGTAKNLAGGVTEMNTVLGVMADNGIKGSEAGTHLRNVILSLSAPTDTAAQAMAELGVSAVDADGNLRPLEDTMGDFNKAFENMTQEEKTQALSKIFNKTDLAAVNALLDTSVDRWDELGNAIEDSSGAAAQMSATMQDNLEGALTTMTSAIEGVQIALAEGMTPAIRNMVDVAGTGFQEMAQQITAGDLVGAFTTLGEVVANLATQIISYFPQMLDAGLQMIVGLVEGIANGAPQLIVAIVDAIMQMVEVIINNIPLIIEAAVQLMVGLAQGLLQALPVVIEKLPEIITAIINALVEAIPMLIDAGIQLFSALVQNLPAIIEALLVAIPEIVEALVNGFIEAAPMLAEAAIELVNALVEAFDLSGLVEVFQQAWDNICAAWEPIIDFFANIWQGICDVFSDVASWFGDVFSSAWDAVCSAWDAAVSWFADIWSGICDAFAEVASFFGDAFSSAWDAVSSAWDAAVSFFADVWNGISDAFAEVASFFGDTFSAAWDAVTSAFSSVASFFAEVWSTIKSAFSNAVSEFFNIGSQIIQGLINGVTSMIGAAISAVSNVVSGMVSAAKGFLGIHSPSRVFAEIGEYTVQGFNDGLEAMADEPINTMANMIDEMSSLPAAQLSVQGNAEGFTGGAMGGYGTGGYGGNVERNFTFNVTINATSDLQNEGRRIAEILYTDIARHDKDWAR